MATATAALVCAGRISLLVTQGARDCELALLDGFFLEPMEMGGFRMPAPLWPTGGLSSTAEQSCGGSCFQCAWSRGDGCRLPAHSAGECDPVWE